MRCDRCQGLLVRDRLHPRGLAWMWRCLNCGDRTDGVVLRHRGEQAYQTHWEQEGLMRDQRSWAVLFASLEALHRPVGNDSLRGGVDKASFPCRFPWRRPLAALVLVLGASLAALGAPLPVVVETSVGPGVLHGCYDGDTCTVSIPGLPAIFGDRLRIRLAGIDTPERAGACAHERALARRARALLERRLRSASTVMIDLVGRDKFFRVDAVVTADGADLGEVLIDADLARPYTGQGPRLSWCPSRTVGPP